MRSNFKLNIFIQPLFIALIFGIGSFLNPSLAQETDNNTDVQYKDSTFRYFPSHSPVKATWMSAALPGLGQYYNQKYWKIPIIYAGFSTLAYFVIQNRYEYNRFKEAYAISAETSNPAESDNILVRQYSQSQLLSQREYYQSNLELSYILTAVFYLLQIVDATVDAHLYYYDIDDNLSIMVQPQSFPTERGIKVGPAIGLKYKLTYH
jgi:hypothetical protein